MTDETHRVGRRTVLKTVGAGAVGSIVLSGSAAAQGGYGNGNAIGAFLNEEALAKDRPIWDSGIADMTGQEEVTVAVGTMVSLDIPEHLPLPPEVEEPPEAGPFGFDPRAIEISPDTTVTWEWTGNDFAFRPDVPWPHDVASLDESHGHPIFHSPTQGTGTYSYTFDEPGTYLYYCHPHGDPFPDDDHPNLFGMRGAVKVTDD